MSLNKGLIGHWTMDSIDNNVARDSTAYKNHGSIENNPSIVNGLMDEDGQSLELNALNPDYINLNTTILSGEVKEITISGWAVKSDDSESWGAIIGQGGSTDARIALRSPDDDKNWSFYVRDETGETMYVEVAQTDEISYGDLHHIVGVFKGGEFHKIYLDGELHEEIELTNFTELDFNYLADLELGRQYGGSRGLNGIIDDVRVYNRALSDDEIKRLYNMRNQSSQRSSTPQRQDLVLYLDASNSKSYNPEDGEDRWHDLSGNGFEAHGTTGEGSLDDSEFPEWTPEAGGSFDFAGTNSLNVPGPIPDSDELTLEFWMKREDTSSDNQYISDARNGNGTWHLTNYRGYNINIAWDLQANDPPGKDYRDDENSSPNSNWWTEWNHFVLISDGSESRLYVNGNRVEDDRLREDAPFNTGLGQDFAIGNRYTGSSSLDGKIAVFRVYKRALPGKQVKMNYEAEKNRFHA